MYINNTSTHFGTFEHASIYYYIPTYTSPLSGYLFFFTNIRAAPPRFIGPILYYKYSIVL